MSKKKKKQGKLKEKDQKSVNTITLQKRKINYLYFIILGVFNIILISNITSNKYYQYYNTALQLLSYLAVLNITFLIYYNFHYNIFKKSILKWFYLFLGISILYIYIISFYPVLDLNGDNAAYLARAKSLISGKGFRCLWLPKEPFDATLKGIGFSILNIPFIIIFGFNNYVGLKLLELFSTFLGLFFMYKYFENKMSKDTLFLLTVMVAMYSQIIHFSTIIMTESVAFFLLFLNLYLIDKYILTDNKMNLNYILKIAGISFLLFFTFTVREAMISLVIAVPLYLLVKKRWKELFTMGFFLIIFFGVYFLYTQHLKNLNQIHKLVATQNNSGENESFLGYYLNVIFNTGINLKSYWISLLVVSQKILGNPDLAQYNNIILNIIILLIFCMSIVIRIRKKIKLNIYDIFFISLITIVIIAWGGSTPIDTVVFSRYFYPLIPIIFFYFILGIESILKSLKAEKYTIYIFLILISLILNNNLERNLQEVYLSKHHYSPAVANFIKACEWIKNNTPNNTYIATRKGVLSYIWANRKATHYYNVFHYNRYDKFSKAFEQDTLKFYKEKNIQYIILDAFSYDAYYKILPIVKNNPEKFKVEYRTAKPYTYVLKIKRGKFGKWKTK